MKTQSGEVTGSHLVLQLILSVHFMLGDVEVVSGVVVHGLHEAGNNVHMLFQRLGQNQEGGGAAALSDGHDTQAYYTAATHSSLNRYGSSSGGSGGDGGGSGGGGAPQGCWLLFPRVNICWKLMSV